MFVAVAQRAGQALVTAAMALVLSLALAACTGPGLEPPDGDNAPNFGTTPGATPATPGVSVPTGTPGITPQPRQDAGPGVPPSDGTRTPADEDADGGVDDAAGDPLFEGLWAVEQPFHALYEATVYELRADGTLLEHDTVTLGATEPGFVTGTVAHTALGINCRFGERWRSDATRRLIIETDCSDAVPRDVELTFPPGDPSQGLVPQVAVDGDSDWAHPGFDWAFRRCAARAGCVQTF